MSLHLRKESEVILNRQNQVFEFIKEHIKKEGYPPTVREIASAVGLLSSSTVHGHLDQLEKRGLIERKKTLPRAIKVIENG